MTESTLQKNETKTETVVKPQGDRYMEPLTALQLVVVIWISGWCIVLGLSVFALYHISDRPGLEEFCDPTGVFQEMRDRLENNNIEIIILIVFLFFLCPKVLQ